MSISVIHSVGSWWTGDVPLLPHPQSMQWGLQASWSVVLAWLGAVLAARCNARRGVAVAVAVALAVSAWLPGQASLSYWLGLAFQMPSMGAVLLCAVLLRRQWVLAGGGGVPALAAQAVVAKVEPDAVLAVLGVLLGWALLLDTLALLPVQLYAWGFSPVGAVLVLLLGLTPWLLMARAPGSGLGAGVVIVAVLLFVLLRLPSGNVWDAVLDPWLWLALHVYVVRRALNCYKNRSCLRAFHKG